MLFFLPQVALDTTAFNGHGTAAESLWTALPLVTLPGDSIGNRVGAAVSLAAGQAALITRSLDDYVLVIQRLLMFPALARSLGQQLRELRSTAPLWDIRRCARVAMAVGCVTDGLQVCSLLGALNAHGMGGAAVSCCCGCVMPRSKACRKKTFESIAFTGYMSKSYIMGGKGVFQRLRLKFVARRVLALAPTGDTTACLKASSFVGGVRVFSLAEALEDGVESEFSDELLVFACLAGCAGAMPPLAGLFEAGSSNVGSGRACFLPAAMTADTIGEGAEALNSAGEAF
jgi:hypothetical protein